MRRHAKVCPRSVLIALLAAFLLPTAASAQVTEFTVPTAASGPNRIAAGPDGALWFTETTANKIGRISTSGDITEFTVPTPGSRPWGITAGRCSDASTDISCLWFTEEAGNKIGRLRITSAGTVTELREFPIPVAPGSGGTCTNRPKAITSGSDGALWFTGMCYPTVCPFDQPCPTESIGRITPSGVAAAVRDFGRFLRPQAGITTGPDSALWFTATGTQSNVIGRITTSGTFNQFTLPDTGVSPTDIAAGPDGALWFPELGNNALGRLTPAGSYTNFPIPTQDALLVDSGITRGPDGALWFAEGSANKIGRITTAGSVTEFSIPTAGSGPAGITVGPDDALWFTEETGNKIGRITATASQCSDGRDNDRDGLIDHPADPSCASAAEDDEAGFIFGKARIGSSFAALSAGEKRASQHLLWYGPVTITKLRAYLDGNGGATGSQVLRGVLYRGAAPGALVAQTEDVTIAAGEAGRWVELPFSSPVRLGVHYYWLGLHSGGTQGVARYAWDPGGAAVRRFNTDLFSDGPSDPFGPSVADNQRLSIHGVGGREPPSGPAQ
jgi:virginiamycin B lyase